MAVGCVVEGLTPLVFSTLWEPQVRMAVWNRPSPGLDLQEDRDIHMAFDGVGVSTSDQAPEWLQTDLQQLGEIFCAVSGSPFWKGRHEIVRERQCPRFHQDAVSVRLITTYAGPGTEWLFAHECGDDLDARLSQTKSQVRTLFPGDVAIMKGSAPGWEAWPDFPVLLHRSPTASPAAPRQVLTLDVWSLEPETAP